MHYAAYTVGTLESWADCGREYWKVVTSITTHMQRDNLDHGVL